MARWIYEIIETFAGDEVMSHDERYRLLARLFAEQCKVVEPTPGRAGEAADNATAGPRVEVIKTIVHGGANMCPHGHAPTRHDRRHIAPERLTLHAFFDSAQCRACPRVSTCPVRGPNHQRSREYRRDISPGIRLRDATFAAQQSTTWQKAYRIRAGAEATMSALKRGHGMRRLRVRRQVRVSLAVSST